MMQDQAAWVPDRAAIDARLGARSDLAFITAPTDTPKSRPTAVAIGDGEDALLDARPVPGMPAVGIALSVVLAGALAGCGPSASTPPSVGEPATFATACDRANDGHRIALEGYLRLPWSFSGSRSVALLLVETDQDRRGILPLKGTVIGVSIDFGSDANQIEQVPDQYSDADLQVHLSDGQVAGQRTKVKVSGEVYFPFTSQDFACGLKNPLVEPAG